MTWYLLWLELRYRLAIAAAFALVGAFIFGVGLYGSTQWFAQSGKIVEELHGFVDLLPILGPERLIRWGLHAWLSTGLALILPFILTGNGIGDASRSSINYNLCLPVSRFHLLWMHLLGTYAVSVCGLAIALVADCLIVVAWGGPRPVGAMLVTTFLDTLVVLPVVALLGFVHLVPNKFLMAFAMLGIFAEWFLGIGGHGGKVSITGFQHTVFLNHNALFADLAAIFAVTGIALAATAWTARVRDF